MRLFNKEIVERLNQECNGDPIHFVGLGAWDFQISFANAERISNTESVRFHLSGAKYIWEKGPSRAPVWLLINQVPTSFELASKSVLRMNLDSGDHVDFNTAEHAYESMVIDFGKRDGAIVTEVF